MVGNDKAAKSRLGLVDLDGFEPSTSSMPWKPDQSLTDKFLVVSCTYRRHFWTPFGPRDLFHAFLDPHRASYSRHVWTWLSTLATGVLLCAHARMLPPFLKCVRWEDIFLFLAIGIPSTPRRPLVGTVWLVGVSQTAVFSTGIGLWQPQPAAHPVSLLWLVIRFAPR